MKVRIPKDVDKYLHPALAGIRLIYVALEHVLNINPKHRVKWTLKIQYYIPQEELDKSTAVAVSMGGTMSSGDPIDGMYDVRDKKE